MSNDDFVYLVRQMREAQNAYFKNKGIDALKKAKTLESQVDNEIRMRQGLPL